MAVAFSSEVTGASSTPAPSQKDFSNSLKIGMKFIASTDSYGASEYYDKKLKKKAEAIRGYLLKKIAVQENELHKVNELTTKVNGGSH